jgi:hypothetical protein
MLGGDVVNAEDYSAGFSHDLIAWDLTRERSQQTKIGMSDLDCRERLRHILIGAPETNTTVSNAAIIGTWIHAGVTDARQQSNPHLLFNVELTTTLSNGFVVPGHADEIDPTEPSLTDYKTVDDLPFRARVGPTDQQRKQIHGYYKGAIEAGLLPERGIVRLVFIDRRGKYDPYTWQESYDPNVIEWISNWLDDVKYAIQHGEQTQRDQPATFCRRFCSFYHSCRPDDNGGEPITDSEELEAAYAYLEASETIKTAEAVKDAARTRLGDVNGVGGNVVVRWTEINGKTGAYSKIDVRRIP